MTSDPVTVAAAAAAADAKDPHAAWTAWDATRERSRQTADRRAVGKWGVGPSDLSSCERWVWYRETTPDGYTPKVIHKPGAVLGTWIHDGLTLARSLAFPWRLFNHRITIGDVTGTADEVDPILGRVTDYKTRGGAYWASKADTTPPPGEWQQVDAYAWGVVDAGTPVREVEILSVDRGTGGVESHVRPYVPARGLAAVARLHAMVEALGAGRELPRVRAGDTLLGPTVNVLCRDHCPAVAHCWGLGDVPAGRTPEGALLARDDPGVAAAADRYVAARDNEVTARAEKGFARALLEGVAAGRYGQHTVKWGGGKRGTEPDLVGRIDVLETEIVTAAAEGRPPVLPWELPSPTRNKISPVSISVVTSKI